MYIPHLNHMTDQGEIIAFMQRFSFATLITAPGGIPVATHLPFLVSSEGDQIVLSSHLAKANTHWQSLATAPSLVIFSEPHAYISPQHYEKMLNVPTWNYIAIHVYGQATLLEESTRVERVLEQTINQYDAAYRQQWDGLPETYKSGMIKGIVAFELIATDIQAKKKLSQNKTEAEQKNIIAALEKSVDTHEQMIAAYMKEKGD
jgi:transcriptional regulator